MISNYSIEYSIEFNFIDKTINRGDKMYANWLIFDFKFNFINKTINKGGKMHVNSTLIYLIDINDYFDINIDLTF